MGAGASKPRPAKDLQGVATPHQKARLLGTAGTAWSGGNSSVSDGGAMNGQSECKCSEA